MSHDSLSDGQLYWGYLVTILASALVISYAVSFLH